MQAVTNAPPIPDSTPQIHFISEVDLSIAAVRATTEQQQMTAQNPQDSTQDAASTRAELMIDSGAATHVCPTWFAPNTPLFRLPEGAGPTLRSVTNDNIQLFGYKWVYMQNNNGQSIVIPFYVCKVHQPILSVTRLAEQGFTVQFSDTPSITHSTGFHSTLVKKNQLYHLQVNVVPLPNNMRLNITRDDGGAISAMIAPTTTLTSQGAEVVLGGNTDYWTFNSQGFLVRIHKRQRKALFTPDRTSPVPLEQLENYRRTIINRADGNNEDLTEQYFDLNHRQQKRVLACTVWTGETWFKVKPNTPKPNASTARPATAQATPVAQPSIAPKTEEYQTPTAPQYRHTSKRPVEATAIPSPQHVAPTNDYWRREGHIWKRVHVQPRTAYYTPGQTDDGPDITRLTPWRQTIVAPTANNRGFRDDDNWTSEPNKTLTYQWTGSTNFEEETNYKATYESDNEEQHTQQARSAKGLPQPKQPTAQERAEHELTHLPYRSWCETCVRTKGRADNHPRQTSKQPVIQVDITYIRTVEEKSNIPILTAIDVETGMCMAALIQDRTQHFEYLVNCIQAFLMETGRAQATLANTTLQSDNEQFITNLLKTAALKMGGNMFVRQSPAYSSQSQGSIERFHRTLAGQIRTIRSQLQDNYDRTIKGQQPIMPWMVRHAAYLLNRYNVHSDGNTSFYRRWNKEHKAPLCIFGETIQYMAPTAKALPKLEQRFFKGIWLGRDTATNEHIIGITNKVIKARTVRRLIAPDSFDKQLLDAINAYPWTPVANVPTAIPPAIIPQLRPSTTKQTTTETQTMDMAPEQTKRPEASTAPPATRPTIMDAPLATSPASAHHRPALPTLASKTPAFTPPKRTRPDDIPEGSAGKQTRFTTARATFERPPAEPAATRQRISALTVISKKGHKITTASNEDEQEQQLEKILLEPMVHNTEGLDREKTVKGMKHEVGSMKQQNVYTEVHYDSLTPEQQQSIIASKWVLRPKSDEVRARIVAKGFTETINDLDDIYASTPIFCVLRWLLALALTFKWCIRTGDISTAFLHAAAATAALFMWPPQEFYNAADKIVWKLNKATYGLRSSPKAWQDHLADILQQHLGLERLKTEPNVYKTPGPTTSSTAYILVYVDDLLFLGPQQTVDHIFNTIQQHLLLRPTGDLTMGQKVSFLGRSIQHLGTHFEISLADEYLSTILQEMNMTDCNPAATPSLKATSEHETDLDNDERKTYRRMVGKLQWLTYTRPDICYATKELARSLNKPTTHDLKKLKHLIRYLQGTKHRKFSVHPTAQITDQLTEINIITHVDADWAGCPTTRRSTTGFCIFLLGTCVHYGSRTQATVALSSAESELYAIGTGATESLHLVHFLKETFGNSIKITLQICTDSSAGKSIATRIGSSKKAKHIELKYLFMRQLVQSNILQICKIRTDENRADILTKHVSLETLLRHLHAVGLIDRQRQH